MSPDDYPPSEPAMRWTTPRSPHHPDHTTRVARTAVDQTTKVACILTDRMTGDVSSRVTPSKEAISLVMNSKRA
jgi:hypothetical protein